MKRCIFTTDNKAPNITLMLLTRSMEQGLMTTTKSIVELIRSVLHSGTESVATRRINQDPYSYTLAMSDKEMDVPMFQQL